jgi:hypothetical protein
MEPADGVGPSTRREYALYGVRDADLDDLLFVAGGLAIGSGMRLRELWCFRVATCTWKCITKVC